MSSVKGKLKFLRCVFGITQSSDEGFIRNLREGIPGLKEESNVEECDVILAFCPVVSRAGTDIESALKKLQQLSETKPAVLVVLHHTFDQEATVPDSSRSVNRGNTLTVDCLFHEDKGLLQCCRNQEALEKVTQWMKLQVKKHDESQTALTKWLKKITEPTPNTTDTQLKQLQQELQRKDEVLKHFLMRVKDKLRPVIKNADRNQRQLKNTQVEDLRTLLSEAEKQLENIDKKNPTEQAMQDKNQVSDVDEEISSENFSDLRLVLLGRAGSEKHAVGNTILGSENIEAGTSITTLRHENVKRRKLAVLETPDELSSSLSQEDIRDCVCLSAPGPHAFLIVIPVNKSTREERGMLEKMEQIFGEMFWRNTIILLTVTDEQQKNDVEKFRSGNQEVQRLVEKCGNRFHCLNIKENGDGSQVPELLEKIEKMLKENPERFYSSEIYQQTRELEKRVMNMVLTKIQEDIVDEKKHIKDMAEKISNLQKATNDKHDKDKKCEIEINKIILNAMKARNNKRKREKTEMEEIHKQDIKNMKETYDGEGWMKKKKELMKIILPEVHCMLWDLQMQLRRQVELREQVKDTKPDPQNPNTVELRESNSNSEEIHHETVNNPDPGDCEKTSVDADEKKPSEEKHAEKGPETEGTCSNVSSVQSPQNT